MTTLDKTEIETARDEFVHSLTKEQIERWAYKWADDLLSTAIALSSIPEQPVGWKLVPIRLTPEMGHALESNIAECAEPSEVHQENWANAWHQAVLLAPQPPSQPAAVAVTDEMVERGVIPDAFVIVAVDKGGERPPLFCTGPCTREITDRMLEGCQTHMGKSGWDVRAYALVDRDRVK